MVSNGLKVVVVVLNWIYVVWLVVMVWWCFLKNVWVGVGLSGVWLG